MKLSDERIAEIWLVSEAPEDDPDDIVLVFARAIEREAYRNGQEAMRERAAYVCEGNAKEDPSFKAHENTYENGWTDAANESGWTIRALEIEGLE